VVERFAALFCGLDEDRQLAADLLLPDVLVELPRPQRALDDLLLRAGDLDGHEPVEVLVFDGHARF